MDIYIDDYMLKYIGYNCTDSRDDKKNEFIFFNLHILYYI